MAIRDKIAANSARFLEPGEQIQSVFDPAQTASQYLILIGLLPFILVNKYRCVVATDRRLLVLDAGKLTTTKPKSGDPGAAPVHPHRPVQRHPVVHLRKPGRDAADPRKRFQKDMEAADAAAAPGAAPAACRPPTAAPAGVRSGRRSSGRRRPAPGGPARPLRPTRPTRLQLPCAPRFPGRPRADRRRLKLPPMTGLPGYRHSPSFTEHLGRNRPYLQTPSSAPTTAWCRMLLLNAGVVGGGL